ncbi:hypothetical protein MNBD_GAMMA15-2544 [hydrothermal vent metagenome]|uniref:Response regulator NasT n=1 Tax=hydrothermal vent metagenome TaxID=652676 RepID=A0A3B0YTZ0_9ZZZZ
MCNTKTLIVDDDRLVLAMLSSGLGKAGYAITSAAGGKEALELIEEEEFDLVILDIRMPDISGIDVSYILNARNIPFLILTAHADAELVESMVDNGALGYLIKPVDVEQIIPAIEAALKRSGEIKQLREKERNLQCALDSDRNTDKAVGILMERYRLTGEDAFQVLRMHARSQRRKLAEVAGELVGAETILNGVSYNTAPKQNL